MAVDTLCWAQSLAPWLHRTIQVPTPVTSGVSGGFGCQSHRRSSCSLGILTLRAVQTAAMAPLWSQKRMENIIWVSLLIKCFGHYRHVLMSPAHPSLSSEIPQHVITNAVLTIAEYTQGMPFHWHTKKRQTQFRNRDLSVLQPGVLCLEGIKYWHTKMRLRDSEDRNHLLGWLLCVYYQIPQNLACGFFFVFFAA